jgi:hypothetical protein
VFEFDAEADEGGPKFDDADADPETEDKLGLE